MLLSGLGAFGLTNVAGGLTTTPGQLILARCFIGLGAAMVFPATLSPISNAFTERAERAGAIGLWDATAGMAIAIGLIVGVTTVAHARTAVVIALRQRSAWHHTSPAHKHVPSRLSNNFLEIAVACEHSGRGRFERAVAGFICCKSRCLP